MVKDCSRLPVVACLALASGTLFAQSAPRNERANEYGEFACRPLVCSSLIPAKTVDDAATQDCGYRNGNQWWVDSVAGSLTWNSQPESSRVTVAVFDDGAKTD